MNLSGKIALITGGASGIGRLVALRLAQRGAHVVLWDINSATLTRAADELRAAGGRVSTFACDVSDRTSIYQSAGRVRAEVGRVDILINNAGVVSGKPFAECSDEQIERTVRVNILGVLWTTKAFLPDMIAANSGHIVNVSSAAGLIGSARLADYSASKFAVFGFDESLRMEFHRRKLKIHTTVVCPFFINTGMFDGVKTRVPWLLPILDQHKVARRIERAILRKRKRLIMPWIVYTAAPLRMLPVRVYDFIANVLGVNHSMDDFKGRAA
jgi:all-trans-retinol dehydrogenase (NAD+)